MSRYAELRREWTEIVEHWSVSGLSGAEFCRRHQLSAARFYTWRRRLGMTAGRGGAGSSFLPLSFTDGPERCGIAVVLGEHLRLDLSVGFDQGELLRAVQALGASSPC